MIARIATKATCLLLLTMLSFVAKAQLAANFTANNTSGCTPQVIRFTDTSLGTPTQWKWDLGNGTISFLQHPSVTYFNPGQYTVKLIVFKGTASDTIIKVKYINVFAQPIVKFTSTAATGCFPLPVQFADQSTAGTGTIANWKWDFGDGTFSALQNPAHIYTASGNYNVSLQIKNNNGCLTTLSKPGYINISAGVKAGFSNTAPNNCSIPANIDFTNSSTGTSALTYQWQFGDGGTSTQSNPSHIYTALGSYSITLIATNTNGCTDTITKNNAIVVGKVKAAFTVADTICTKQPVIINNTSAPMPLFSNWSFGDGTFATTPNAIKTYAVAGTYQIKLVANFGSCGDSIIKKIVVMPKPTAAFTSADTVACSAPLKVNFNNKSTNEVSWSWNFGDGGTSTWQTPSHVYNSTGNYTVQLIVTNANGCTDTIIKTKFIKIQPPKVLLADLPDSGCVPFTKSFGSSLNLSDPIVSYLWNFGDGATSTSATPMHTYNTAGVFTITLIVTTAGGCRDTIIQPRGIITSIKPVANFTATPRNTCATIGVTFSDISTGTVTHWLWDFGDGFTSTLQKPVHIYSDTGMFTVQLIISNGGCSDTVKLINYIHISAPIARFNANMDCKKPYERMFQDMSIGADEWYWDFGDGTTSTLKNPIHTYALKGTYQVSLRVVNHLTGCAFTIINPVTIVAVKAAFEISDSVICKGKIINFTTGLSTAEVTAFYWNFGDGTSAMVTTNSTTHLYTVAGNYTVRLITTDILNCQDTLSKPTSIRVNGPVAKFMPSVPGSCLNNAITFTDLSADDGLNPIKKYAWNYGDGSTETLAAAPFKHTYSIAGAYAVSLVITDSVGCADSFKLVTPLIISKPIAAFITVDTLTCPSKPVQFTNQSTGPNLTYLWHFGDGTTSTLAAPVHTYPIDGMYGVTLFITDKYGCTDSLHKTNYITIITPVANFLMSDSLSACPPLIVKFTNQSSNAIQINWDFGDGTSTATDNPSHFYNYPGSYVVTLTIEGPGGCSSVQQRTVAIKGPTGTFTYTPLIGCVPLLNHFTAVTSKIASIIWDFNDGTIIDTTGLTISHNYTYAGSYLPKIILTDKDGCHVPIKGLDTIVVNGVTSAFSFFTKPLCDSGSVSFKDSSFSNDLITDYSWAMGDGASSTDQNPTHYYPHTGIYYPSLVVTTLHGCKDSLSSPIPVKIVASPHIEISTTANGCTPLTMVFKGLVTVADTSSLTWQWTLGNNRLSTLQNPVAQIYTVAGVYDISLLATNSSGCKDSGTKNIEAYIIPTVSAGNDSFICQRRGINLLATGAVSYNWSPAAGLSCVTCANPVAMPDSLTSYIVKGTSIHGCTAQNTVRIQVKYPFKIRYGTSDTLCKGQSKRLFVSGAATYIWTPAIGLSSTTSTTPAATPDVTTNYMVVGKDDKGCFADTGHVFLKVYPIPVVDAGPDKTINIGQAYDLMPTISADVTEVLWTPTSGIFRSSFPGITIKPNTTTDYTVNVKNAGGCTSQDRVTVFVICDGTNVFIPNTFSPNGDGANDIFYPRGSGLFKIKSLRIFNRWGEVVFEKSSFNANDASAGWDGTFKGGKLNPDVYVYTIEIICNNNSLLVYKGNIALIQ